MSYIDTKLPFEILNMICEYLLPEDLINFADAYTKVKDSKQYRKLMNETLKNRTKWTDLQKYANEHEHCIHVCLGEVTVNPHCKNDLLYQKHYEYKCDFNGRGILCFASNFFPNTIKNNFQNKLVPIKKHFHCNCFDSDDNHNDSSCPIHACPMSCPNNPCKNYEEEISFSIRNAIDIEELFNDYPI